MPLALTRSIVYPPAAGAAELTDSADLLAIGVAVAIGVDLVGFVALALGARFTATPLFQTNLPLFLIQVNLRPETVEDCPAFLQAAPSFAFAEAGGAITRAKATAAPVAIA